MPSLAYLLEVNVTCLDPPAGADNIRIVMVNPAGSVPLLTAQLKMPVSEPEDA